MSWRPDREAVAVETDGQAHRRNTGQVRGDREHVGQVHRERIVGSLPDAERRGRRRRRHQDVEAGERLLVVADDQRADLLGLAVVRLVVAGGQRVRAEHDATLHLGPEPRASRPHHHLDHVGVLTAGAGSVADAVVPSEVGRRLARRDQVVRGERVVRVRQLDLADLGAERRETLDRDAHRVLHADVHTVAEGPLHDADTQSGDARVETPEVVVDGHVQARRVPRVVTREDAEEGRGVADGPREGADGVERRREGDRARTG